MNQLGRHEGTVHALALAPDGRTLYSAGDDGCVRAWPGGRVLVELPEDQSPNAIAVAPDGAWLALGSSFGQVLLVHAAGGTPRDVTGEPPGHGHGDGNGVIDVAIDARGRIAAAGGNEHVDVRDFDGRILWAAQTYKWPFVVRFSPDGKRLAIASWDNQLYLPELSPWSGDLVDLESVDGCLDGPAFALEWTATDELVIGGVTNSADGGYLMRHRVAEQGFAARRQLAAPVHVLARAPGDRLLVGDNDGAVTAWSLPDLVGGPTFAFLTAPQLARSRRHLVREFHDPRPGAVTALAAASDGRVFVGFLDGGLAELEAVEFERGGAFIDQMAMVRTIRDVDAAVAKQHRIAAILERGKTDPLGALSALREEDPALADRLVGMLAAKIRQREGDE